MNSKSEIPWLRTLVFAGMLASLFSIALIVATRDWYAAIVLFGIESVVLFVVLVVGMWWSDSRRS